MTAPMTREQAQTIFAELYRGTHRMHAPMRQDGTGVFSTLHAGELATFDDDMLTRLVLIAHRWAARCWVTSAGPRGIRIWVQARDRASKDISHGHPPIALAIAKFQEDDDGRWWRWLERSQPKETE